MSTVRLRVCRANDDTMRCSLRRQRARRRLTELGFSPRNQQDGAPAGRFGHTVAPILSPADVTCCSAGTGPARSIALALSMAKPSQCGGRDDDQDQSGDEPAQKRGGARSGGKRYRCTRQRQCRWIESTGSPGRRGHRSVQSHRLMQSTKPTGSSLPDDGQRCADQGDGTFVNPIVAGDHADPTILKDGEDYYMTFSSFLSYPGIVIWHSTDLVSWVPICSALWDYIGSVWALDLVKHAGRYYIYIPAVGSDSIAIFVIHADNVRGPWSKPIDLGIRGAIDPGHAVGEDGKRYLFVNGVRRIQLADDGLSTIGQLEHVYEPWRYPEDWVVEMFAPEGPKIFRHGEWFYLVSAVGGTAGPPTSHMVTAARSRSIHGPWEHSPHNPIVRTTSADEPWWSRGHATIVEGPAGDFWFVYHGYENGFRTLGRQTLLEPIEWSQDGWFHATGKTLALPLPKPLGGKAGPSHRLSDDFTNNRLGTTWAFFDPGADYLQRVRYEDGSLVLSGKGSSPADCSPLTCIAGDRSYE